MMWNFGLTLDLILTDKLLVQSVVWHDTSGESKQDRRDRFILKVME